MTVNIFSTMDQKFSETLSFIYITFITFKSVFKEKNLYVENMCLRKKYSCICFIFLELCIAFQLRTNTASSRKIPECENNILQHKLS